ncbi:uncharacterized protein LOC124124541 isoform X2 [Haliotis rufescens]|uniref:uncharacterized protein LOC124124541 isoform X2 n=1 Tax=Haliotis rufescens TaxID=6454 RepID=UPI00201F2122|nr:uncharacterized protein LOC124124541 isoform X2 [Haliotis rufescens]
MSIDTSIYVGGLRRDVSHPELREHLIDLFACFNFHVQRRHILIINTSSDYRFAFVDLQDVGKVNIALHFLSSRSSQQHVSFDFTLIKDPNNNLIVEQRRRPNKPRNQIVDLRDDGADNGRGTRVPMADAVREPPVPSSSHQDSHAQTSTTSLATQISPNPISPPLGNGSGTRVSVADAVREPPVPSSSHQDSHAQTSTTSLATQTSSNPISPPLENAQLLSSTTSVSFLGRDAPERFCNYRDILENRIAEITQGHYPSPEYVGKSVCAFLNTNGGTLFIGEDNHGNVVGVVGDQEEEDRQRLTINQVIESITPPVLSDLYSIDFVPVLNESESFTSNRKVIEVKVKDPGDHGDLYLYLGDPFIHRDGSVQMMEANERQQWERQRFQESQDEVMAQQMEMDEKLNLQSRNLDLMRRNLDLERRNLELEMRRRTSTVCSVM